MYKDSLKYFQIFTVICAVHQSLSLNKPFRSSYLGQLLAAQTAVLVSIYILEHAVHQSPPLVHGGRFPVREGPRLHVQQHALQLVVLCHGARVACKDTPEEFN